MTSCNRMIFQLGFSISFNHHMDRSRQAAERVFGFGFRCDEVAVAPENTRLQRALKEYLLGGGEINICEGYRKVSM